MSDYLDPAACMAIYESLVESLASREPRTVQKTSQALQSLGPMVVHHLLLDVETENRSTNHRVRILNVIEQIGELADEEDFQKLVALADDIRPISAVATRILAKITARWHAIDLTARSVGPKNRKSRNVAGDPFDAESQEDFEEAVSWGIVENDDINPAE